MLRCASSPSAAQTQAALDRFDARLQASGSATATLGAWLEEKNGASGAKLLAHIRATDTPRIAPALVTLLGVEEQGAVQYRRVWLAQGSRVMSVAENWYVGARLTGIMETELAESATPFGAVIAPLAPRRETLVAERLWPEKTADITPARLPGAVLRHEALVRAGDGTPLCVVNEVYTRNIIL